MKRMALKRGNSILKTKKPLGCGKNYTGLKSNSTLKTTSTLKQTKSLKPQSDKARELWVEARGKCIIRDGGKCQVCGQPGTQVHHIHLRSKRKDLLYSLNNLILLCDKHHFHQGMVKYKEQTELIALAKKMSVEELLNFAETKGNDNGN